MKKTKNRSAYLKELVLIALLSAIVAVLAYYGGFIRIGSLASVSLTLIPVVIGATLCGPYAGAFLGGVAGVMFFTTPDSVFWMGLSIHGTIITVMVKGILSGLCAGIAFKLLKNVNCYLAALISAIVCPVVNTGIFLLGSLVFFMDTVKSGAITEGISIGGYLIVFFVGLNFVFELIANVAVSPAIVSILNIAKKMRNK